MDEGESFIPQELKSVGRPWINNYMASTPFLDPQVNITHLARLCRSRIIILLGIHKFGEPLVTSTKIRWYWLFDVNDTVDGDKELSDPPWSGSPWIDLFFRSTHQSRWLHYHMVWLRNPSISSNHVDPLFLEENLKTPMSIEGKKEEEVHPWVVWPSWNRWPKDLELTTIVKYLICALMFSHENLALEHL